jgi:SAM-dependent methyltransferase
MGDAAMSDSNDRNPQAKEMADESMVRTLAAQADMIWPQERPLFERYGLSGSLRVLDVGCGTGEITQRLADLYPEAELVGIDVVEGHLVEARDRYQRYGERLRFECGDAFKLDYPDQHFDLAVCRHMIQSVPDQQLVIRELFRVTKPGGVLHVIAEDYHMLSFHPGAGEPDPDEFWRLGPITFGERVDSDLRIGRKIFPMLLAEGGDDIAVNFVVVDTLRVDRAVFTEMMIAWRDGYTDGISENTDLTRNEVVAHFDAMIATLRDPERYSVWQVPVWTCRR